MTIDVVDPGGARALTSQARVAEQPTARRARPRRSLRLVLAGLDGAVLFAGWFVAAEVAMRWSVGLQSIPRALMVGAVAALVGLLTAAMSGLYRARVCAVRTVEVALLGRVVVVSAAAAGLMGEELTLHPPALLLVGATAFVFGLLNVERGMFNHWVRAWRAQGRYARPIAIIGTNDEAYELQRILSAEPELGYQVAGVIGPWREEIDSWEVPWLGTARDAVRILHDSELQGCVIAVSAFTMAERQDMLHDLLAAGGHVQLSSGIARISHQRLRAVPLGREPAFYVEPHRQTAWQRSVKRALDITVVVVSAPLVLPIVALAALAIRIDSRGGVIYRQERVGRDGRRFTMYKLRTMVDRADEQLAELADQNERTDGPLFKLESDPRVTRVGRFLRATSIDELPQLFCVLIGTMSLVGPRPPLPDEVEAFDRELRCRFAVTPGITGLWQVEARDNPSFYTYRRYDLFYVENWSVRLDLAILVRTFEAVLMRGVGVLRRPHRHADTAEVVGSDA